MLAYGREGIGYDTLELVTKVVGVKLLDVHYRGKVFLREPRAALADFLPSDVARIAPGSFAADTIVLPKTILQKLLRKLNLKEPPIMPGREGYGRVQKCVGIAHVKHGNAFFPNINHCAIEGEHELFASLLRLLFGNFLHGLQELWCELLGEYSGCDIREVYI